VARLAMLVHCAGRRTVEWTLASVDRLISSRCFPELWAVIDALMLVPSCSGRRQRVGVSHDQISSTRASVVN